MKQQFFYTYQMVLPLSLESLVPDEYSVRTLQHEFEELQFQRQL